LYDALVSGRVAGAALDVVRPRADGSSNPLLALPNVIIAPHIGGATFEAALRGVTILAEQVEHYVNGEPMRFVANEVSVGSAQ
jgi:D-3-phosphoglycerate dehydrogenase / 2-oxoglutarate reductase